MKLHSNFVTTTILLGLLKGTTHANLGKGLPSFIFQTIRSSKSPSGEPTEQPTTHQPSMMPSPVPETLPPSQGLTVGTTTMPSPTPSLSLNLTKFKRLVLKQMTTLTRAMVASGDHFTGMINQFFWCNSNQLVLQKYEDGRPYMLEWFSH